MNITYLGHSCFLIEWKGLRIVTDPYQSGAFGNLNYDPENVEADIVTISHHHDDHGYTRDLKGAFTVVDVPGVRTFNGLTITGVASDHDRQGGHQRGKNIIFKITDGNLTVVHFGDQGRPITAEESSLIGHADVVLVPVGGYYTIEPEEAYQLCLQMNPAVVVPMHYKTPKLGFPVAEVEKFLSLWPSDRVRRMDTCQVAITDLPKQTEVWVLKHCR
ncbi:MBL fold metallo-hydrolase [Coprothermobacteraceae bacterium]|nr:MBL fold metallo-hydrolase [Coprothermobacteraceae bacterium]